MTQPELDQQQEQSETMPTPLLSEAQHTHSASTSTHDTSTSNHQDRVIPDSLLALVKDSRYIQEFQSLFLKVLSTILPRRRHQLLEEESRILASLLCLALGMRHTQHQTTLGMEALGLKWKTSSANTSNFPWKFVVVSVAALGWAYAFSPLRTLETSNHNSNNVSSNPTNVDQELRGLSRRQFHEQQRQAMLQRANQTAATSTTNSTSATSTNPSFTNNSGNNGRSIMDSLVRRMKTIFLLLAKVLASTILAPIEGPHTLPSETHHQQQLYTLPTTNNAIQQAGRWLAKLQLAHFCLTGTYPTWIHRLSGHSMIPSSATTNSLVQHQPTTVRLTGLLLATQAVATLIQASSSAASHWLVRKQQYRQQQQQSQQQQPESAPAIVFQTEPETNNNTTSSSCSICSICKTERNYPAAPSSCGHVFCWNCLLHWTNRIRQECPLCRAPCKPQDVLALHDYEPS